MAIWVVALKEGSEELTQKTKRVQCQDIPSEVRKPFSFCGIAERFLTSLGITFGFSKSRNSGYFPANSNTS